MTKTAPPPVRICLVIGSLERCGTSIHLLAFLRNLDRTRYLPWVVGLAEPGGMVDPIRALGVEVHALTIRSMYSWKSIKTFFWLAARIRRTKTPIVQSYLFLDNLFAPLAARLGGARVVITGRRTVDEWESPRHRWIYRMTNPLVDRIVAVSPQVAASVVRWEKVPEGKVTMIRNAQSRETLGLRADSAEDSLLQELDRKIDGGFVFGSVGNIRPIKGHDVLVRAFARIVSRHPRCHLVLVGGIVPGPPEIERMIITLGLSESVHLPGLRTNVAGFMERFSVFVLPSLAEGMSNALLEALAMGKPVIATRFGLPQAESGSDVVLPVDPGDVDGLAEAMEKVLTDDALREKLAAQSKRFALEMMNEGRMAREYEQLYQELSR